MVIPLSPCRGGVGTGARAWPPIPGAGAPLTASVTLSGGSGSRSQDRVTTGTLSLSPAKTLAAHSLDSPPPDYENSSDDEDLKRAILYDKWRQLFDKYDVEGYGEIPWDDLLRALVMPDFIAQVCPNKREMLAEKAYERKTTAITFQDFVNVMTDKRRRSFKCALHSRDGLVSSQNDFHIIFKQPPIFSRMVHVIANEFLTDERDRKYYADHYTCWPPPFFIITITLVELCFFTYYTLMTGEMNPSRPVPTDSIFIYRPDKRLQVWRFVFYMVLHAGWLHLLFNLLVQVLVGLPLEMVHGSFRIGIVYMAGVLAGSLGTSVFDTEVYLVGASGGVYALLAAHLANILLNFNNMEFGVIRLLGIFVIVSADVGFAVYDRHAAEMLDTSVGCHPVSYVAHLTGALAGLTIGLLVLKNFEQKLHEQLIWWIALGVYAACTIFAILFNICSPSYADP
ncbi:unnamed protein product [Bemisia tabaci]|uniref:rhomboid protease n=2 Tax=Bemisia tabaci TaxID=7038 RepID=A0A9P0F2J3_BEMTA|nr:unnamed protein product [Bemisia tabaci]